MGLSAECVWWIWKFMSGLGSTMSTSIYHRMGWVFFPPKYWWLMVVINCFKTNLMISFFIFFKRVLWCLVLKNSFVKTFWGWSSLRDSKPCLVRDDRISQRPWTAHFCCFCFNDLGNQEHQKEGQLNTCHIMPPIFCQRLILFTFFETWGGEDEVSDVRFQVPKWDPVHCWIHKTFSAFPELDDGIPICSSTPIRSPINWMIVGLPPVFSWFKSFQLQKSNHWPKSNTCYSTCYCDMFDAVTCPTNCTWSRGCERQIPDAMHEISPWNAAMSPWHFIYFMPFLAINHHCDWLIFVHCMADLNQLLVGKLRIMGVSA